MCKESINFKNCKIIEFPNQYLIDFAKKNECEFIIRGIRDETDYPYERRMAIFNEKNSNIQTIWIPSLSSLSLISSSFVKGLCGPENWQSIVKPMVPEPVFKKLLFIFK